MNLSDQQITDFIEAWQKDFGETLSFETAKAEATRLADFFVQMENAMRTQRALTNKANRPPAYRTPKEASAKRAWRKMMANRG